MRNKADVVADLRGMLKDVLAAKAAGQTYARLARAHGYVDGYMRALLDMDILDRKELLALVAAERDIAGGPALGEFGARRAGSGDEAQEDTAFAAA